MDNSILHILRNTAVVMFACVGFVSCSQDEVGGIQGEPLAPGEYPLEVKAELKGHTRANGKDTWTIGDDIAVTIGGTTYKYRIKNTNGTTEFADDTKGQFYWQSTMQVETVIAWYPFGNKDEVNMVHPTFRVIRQSCKAYNLSLK